MRQDYDKFLSQKLFLIEAISLRNWLKTKDKEMKKIHDICIASLQELEQHVEKVELC